MLSSKRPYLLTVQELNKHLTRDGLSSPIEYILQETNTNIKDGSTTNQQRCSYKDGRIHANAP